MDSTHNNPFVKIEEDGDDDAFEDDSEEDDGTYRPRPQLPTPAKVLRSLAYLMKGLDAGIIDVDPDYQREVVWTADRMTGLVNSLMENFYIPPIILNKKPLPHEDGSSTKYTMVCVDGKQRLSSVQAFIKGMIPCHDYRGEKWWFCTTPTGKARSVLSETVQKQFLAKEFVSFEFADLSPEQEEDLFARVQMGLQLTAAEKMRAATGPWQELGKTFVNDFPRVVSLLKDRTRSKDFQMVLACFSQIIEVQYPNAANGIPILRTNVLWLAKFVENRGALTDDTRSHLAAVFKKFDDLVELDPEIFTNTEKRLKGVQTFAPIEMVSIAVLISMYSDERNDRLLLGDIRYFRNLLRENFVDLRMNAILWKFSWEFIDNLEQVRGAVDGTTIRGAARRPRPSSVIAPSAQASSPVRGALSLQGNILASPDAARGRTTAVTTPARVDPKPVTAKRHSNRSVDPGQSKKRRVHPESPVAVKSEPAEPVSHSRPSPKNGYQVPVAPMGSASASAPPTRSPEAPIAPMMLPYHRTSKPQTKFTNSNVTPTAASTGTPQQYHTPSAPKTLVPSNPESDDIIDLTSDTELERQGLLSTFRSRATNERATVPTPSRKDKPNNGKRSAGKAKVVDMSQSQKSSQELPQRTSGRKKTASSKAQH